ncbi:MAG: inositol monophosphatase [Chlorobi bacterium]|nr:inositol monophosphatase [Chlorobiota bacterium]
MNLKTLTTQVAHLSKAIGHFIKNEVDSISEKDIRFKGLHDLVTYVDKESEKRIIDELSKILPEAGFIAEEEQQLERAERFNWIVDPLDGTTNFVHGIPLYSVSIALSDKDEIISGVIYEANRDECFTAWKNGGSYLNGKKIQVSSIETLNNSLLATGFPYYDYSLMSPYLGLFEDLMKTTQGIRRLGSAAVDLAYVACGRFEAFYEYGLHPWDVAAGTLIVDEAGGKVSDFKGGNDFVFGRQIVASNLLVHDEFLSKLNSFFGEYL